MARFRVQYTEIKPGGHRDRQDDIIMGDYADCIIAELAQRSVDTSTIRVSVCMQSDGPARQIYPVAPVADFTCVRAGRYVSTSRPEVVIQRERYGSDVWGVTQWALLVHGQRVALKPTLGKLRALAAAGIGEAA